MDKIIKGKETMTSKERVRAVLHREKPDRVPIDYMANPGIDSRLKAHLGLKADDWQGLYDMLGMDFRNVGAPYTGPVLHTSDRPDRNVNSMYGWITRWVENKSGGYSDFCDFPLKNAGLEEVAAFALPDPDNFNYDYIESALKANENKAIFLGNAGLACIINNAGFFRGMEQTFVDLITEDEAGLLLIDRFIGQQLAVLEREIGAIDKIAKRTGSKVSDLIEFVWMGEDLGTQNTPLISMELFKSQILPRQKPFFDLCRQYDLPTLLHTCGSSSWTYEEYIKAGLTGVDTLQPEAKYMDPEYLKKKFGGRLVFHGCISTGGPLAFGTADETAEYCKNTLEIMMPGYEYCFSPTHSLQDNTPVENIVAAYNTAHKYGRY